jgi:N-acetyltransferase 10
LPRYEIEGGTAEWEDAEKRVLLAAKSGKANPLVSVKSRKEKRKAEPETAEVRDDEFGGKGKKAKREKRDKRK